MTSHNQMAYNAVNHAVKNHSKKSGKRMYTAAKHHANRTLSDKAMLNGAANYYKNHPGSKHALKLLNHALKK